MALSYVQAASMQNTPAKWNVASHQQSSHVDHPYSQRSVNFLAPDTENQNGGIDP